MSSLAQDELGHAAGAVRAARRADRRRDADALAYDREPDEYRHCRLLDHGRGDWAMTIARRYLYDTADAVRLEALVGGSWAPLAELVGKILREERYHLMHVDAWLERLARGGGEPRDRLLAALDDARPRRRRRSSRRSPASRPRRGRDPRRADGRARGALARGDRADVRPARPADAAAGARPGARPDRPRRRRSAGCGGEFTTVRRSDPGATW